MVLTQSIQEGISQQIQEFMVYYEIECSVTMEKQLLKNILAVIEPPKQYKKKVKKKNENKN